MLVFEVSHWKSKGVKALDGFIPNPKLKRLDHVSEVMRALLLLRLACFCCLSPWIRAA
jgi:hypothetical protein